MHFLLMHVNVLNTILKQIRFFFWVYYLVDITRILHLTHDRLPLFKTCFQRIGNVILTAEWYFKWVDLKLWIYKSCVKKYGAVWSLLFQSETLDWCKTWCLNNCFCVVLWTLYMRFESSEVDGVCRSKVRMLLMGMYKMLLIYLDIATTNMIQSLWL